MLETSISSFIDSISIYRSRVLETRVPKNKTDLNLEIWRKTEEEQFEAQSEETKRRFEEEDLIWRGTIWSLDLLSKNEERRKTYLNLEIWRKTEEERFEARSEETKRRFEEEDLIWRGTIWSSNLPSKNEEEERSNTLKNMRKKKWNSSLKNSISTNRDLKTRFLSWNSSFRHSIC